MTLEYPLLSGAGMVCLAAAAGLLGRERERRLAGAGLLILGLALAAWRAGSPPGAGLAPPTRLGGGFLVGNGGLLLLGLVLVCGAALRAPPGPLRIPARFLMGAGAVLLGPVVVGFLAAAGPVRAMAASLGLGLTGVALAVGARAITARVPLRTAARRVAPPPLPAVLPPYPGARWMALLLVVATAATGLGSHVALIHVGLSLATCAGYLAFHGPGARPVPVAPALSLLLLPAYWLLATIAGPVGLRVSALPHIPLSPAAERLVSAALLLAGWTATGLWPLQRQLPGAFASPVGALLLARVALPLAADGLAYWRPVTVPLLLLGLWNAAAYGRWPLLLAGAGFLGVAGGTPEGIAASAGLLVAGLGLELCSTGVVPPKLATVLRRAAWPLGAWGGLGVVEAGLRGEVVYTALGALGLALTVAAGRADAAGRATRAR